MTLIDMCGTRHYCFIFFPVSRIRLGPAEVFRSLSRYVALRGLVRANKNRPLRVQRANF